MQLWGGFLLLDRESLTKMQLTFDTSVELMIDGKVVVMPPTVVFQMQARNFMRVYKEVFYIMSISTIWIRFIKAN